MWGLLEWAVAISFREFLSGNEFNFGFEATIGVPKLLSFLRNWIFDVPNLCSECVRDKSVKLSY